jgi:hypothetical protein
MSLLGDDYVGSVRWPRLKQDVAIVTWPSFLVASVATMICFAFIDPVLVGNAHDGLCPRLLLLLADLGLVQSAHPVPRAHRAPRALRDRQA